MPPIAVTNTLQLDDYRQSIKHAGGEARIVDPSTPVADLVASFQQAVVDVLVDKTISAAGQCSASRVVVTGGVAANSQLRGEMQKACTEAGLQLVIPHPRLCTDNGAMIAAAAHWRMQQGHIGLDAEALLELDAASDDQLV